MCISGEHPRDFSLLQGPVGGAYTDYPVKFSMTIDGKEVQTWQQTIRVHGGHSWYGYDYRECFTFQCQENKSAQLPDNLPSKLVPKVKRQLRKICTCETDRSKACAALDRAAEKAVLYIKADAPYKGKAEFGKFKKDLLQELHAVHRIICEEDNKKAAADVMDIIEEVEAWDTSEAAEGYENRYRYLFQTEAALLDLKEKAGCPTPCTKGTRKKTAADDQVIEEINQEIEEIKSHTEDQIQQIKDEILEGAAKTQPGSKTDKLNQLNRRLGRLQRLRSAWEQVKKATCVPDELMTNTKKYIRERQNAPGLTQDECNELCAELGKWVREL